MARLSIGHDDFRDIRENGLYYVDKTGLLRYILSRKDVRLFVFNRPRRFGKSLNLSMIDAFLNLRYGGNRWFDGLEVMEDGECTGVMNSFPIVRLNLSNISTSDYDMFLADLSEKIKGICRGFDYLLGSEYQDIIKHMIQCELSESEILDSLKILSDILYRHHGRRVVVLIDEYDYPMDSSYGKEVHRHISVFMRDFMAHTFAGNGSILFGSVMGIIELSEDSMFSGLDGILFDNVFSDDCGRFFGFTDAEVEAILSDSCGSQKMGEVRDLYLGYRFGYDEICNPWDLALYIQRGFEPRAYWMYTGGSRYISNRMREIGPDALRMMVGLFNGEKTVVSLKIDMMSVHPVTLDGFLILLIGSGYLKAIPLGDGSWNVDLVNGSVRRWLPRELVTGRWTWNYMEEIVGHIFRGESEDLRMDLWNSICCDPCSSGSDVGGYHQSFVLGLIDYLGSDFRVEYRRDTGDGHADIVLIPMRSDFPSVVLRLMDFEGGRDVPFLHEIAEVMLSSIQSSVRLSDRFGTVLCYGIASSKDDISVAHEVL